MKKVLGLLLGFILFGLCFAHQPRLVYKLDLPTSNPLQIENPNISQAFYAQLKGSPEYYSFSFDKEYTGYISIVIPHISGATKDFSFELQKNGTTIITTGGVNFQRGEFYEEFAGDEYFQGPEFKQLLGTGDYLIKVFSDDNVGKYVLAVGEVESFPLDEIIHTYKVLPEMKRDYFGKDFFNIFLNYVGIAFLVSFLLICVFIFLIIILIKKYGKRK